MLVWILVLAAVIFTGGLLAWDYEKKNYAKFEPCQLQPLQGRIIRGEGVRVLERPPFDWEEEENGKGR